MDILKKVPLPPMPAACPQVQLQGGFAGICGTPKAIKRGLLGELLTIGAGSSMKRKFKYTCYIRTPKLVAGWTKPNKGRRN